MKARFVFRTLALLVAHELLEPTDVTHKDRAVRPCARIIAQIAASTPTVATLSYPYRH
jgi:hypothetical protein